MVKLASTESKEGGGEEESEGRERMVKKSARDCISHPYSGSYGRWRVLRTRVHRDVQFSTKGIDPAAT